MNKDEEIQAGMIQQSLAEQTQVMDKQSLLAAITEVQELTKKVPEDQVDALKAISMLLHIMNTYTVYIDGLKKEMMKLLKVNEAQLQTIKTKFKEGKKSSILKPNSIV
jgi:hypothetical protein